MKTKTTFGHWSKQMPTVNGYYWTRKRHGDGAVTSDIVQFCEPTSVTRAFFYKKAFGPLPVDDFKDCEFWSERIEQPK